MDINSTISGISSAQGRFDMAATSLVSKTLSGNSGSQDITKEVGDMKTSKAAFTANIRVSKVQNDMLGEVIDILA